MTDEQIRRPVAERDILREDLDACARHLDAARKEIAELRAACQLALPHLVNEPAADAVRTALARTEKPT